MLDANDDSCKTDLLMTQVMLLLQGNLPYTLKQSTGSWRLWWHPLALCHSSSCLAYTEIIFILLNIHADNVTGYLIYIEIVYNLVCNYIYVYL